MNVQAMIRSLYPRDVSAVQEGVDRLLKKYAIDPGDVGPLSRQDAIMITYGDAFQSDQGSPLDCLCRFACEQLGDSVSAIHLLPCFPYTSDDGFSVQDYYEINPDLGDWDDVHRLGQHYQLMFDAVVNHISQQSRWFQAFLAGDPEYQDFFFVADPHGDYSQVVRPRALPLLHPYQKGDETVYVWTTFSEDQIDLNFHSSQVFLRVLDVLLFYVSRGARYIRLDAIAFIWKQIGTTCIHLPQTHRIIQLYRQLIETVAPHVVIITETNVPHAENVSYFGDGTNEAHMVYNFTLPPLLMYSLHRQDVQTLTRWAEQLTLPGEQACFFNFTASHDGVGVRPLQGIVSDQEIMDLAKIASDHGGFVSMKDNGDGTRSPYEINCNYLDFATHPEASDELRVQRFLLTQSVMLCMPGVPGIYYHSLVGSQNDRQAALESGINRRINRQKLRYEPLAEQLADPATIRHAVFTRYKQMLQTRRQQPAFDPWSGSEFRHDGPVFVIERGAGSQRLIAAHNFSDAEARVGGIPSGATDVLTGESVPSDLVLQPFQFRWIR
ncbi:sugar phosphorylase [Roseiconus nitratireducens]|uniref:Sugar phosphorylase n=1 Tax=Roseiconus nitratireducens TaxID=2605748 RepID=A0A5M6DF80_9BACT|nr:alpha-amylase family glycosyl hydrolase [Roseiconus nitratireducens]KAA5546221.1 sugar phosphorylase [Roseiconus nitratireducens]